MKWECEDNCGACCEILPMIVWGHDCLNYDSDKKKCRIYEGRPDDCRTKDTNTDEDKIEACDRLRTLQGRMK